MYQHDCVNNGTSEYVVGNVYVNTAYDLRNIFKIMWVSLFFDTTFMIILTLNVLISCSLTLAFV